MNEEEEDKFRKETVKLLFETRDLRSEVLIIHLALEQLINKIIEEKFKKPKILFENRFLNEFSSKVDILASMGISSNLIADIRCINTIRNIFAHELFSVKKIPKEVEDKIRDMIRSIIDRNIEQGITPKENKSKLINAPTEIMLSSIGQCVIIELLAYITIATDSATK